MTGTRLSIADREWLAAATLVDDGVDMRGIRLHVGGLPGLYLRAVGNSAITFGNHVWFVSEERKADLPLLSHELVHVGQYRRLGTVRFLVKYGSDLVRAGFRYSRELPLEAPAYERQAETKRLLDARAGGAGPVHS